MKKIIYRIKATGKISHDSDYDEYFRRCIKMDEKELLENITEFNRNHENIFAEIVELDDIAEFYAKRAETYFDVPDDISKRLRDIASDIDNIATEIEAVVRK